jgi:hypothetical protein
MSRACARIWQAEAIEDGRLDGDDAASFVRHAASCAGCSAEARALASLRRRASEVAPSAWTDLEFHRARATMLQRAAARSSPRRPARTVWAALALALAVAVSSVAFLLVRSPRDASPPPVAAEAPSFDVTDLGGAAVSSRLEGGSTRATLSAGDAVFHVEHVAPARRFLLSLPDGEIEVRGTRFLVSIRDGHTARVAVLEGVVALRLEGQPERVLRAGDAWTAPPAPASVPLVDAASLPIASSPAKTPRRPMPPAVQPPPQPDAGPASDASRSFAEAMSLFQSASYEAADRSLAAFLRDHPEDARTEDASFLRAVARSRLGDSAGAATLAAEYLRRFPAGLRRREAERLLAPGPLGDR